MVRAFAKITSFVFIVIMVFIYVGYTITRVSGRTGGMESAIEGVSPEAGEKIFWGKGRCYTCHSIGTQGSAIRCPNLGVDSKFSLPIWERAATRKKGMSAIEYLIECIYNPSAYVVEGYSDNVMPHVKKPPVAITDDEIQAVQVYLISLSTEVDGKIINSLAKAQQPYKTGKIEVAEASPEIKLPEGDSEEGRYAYEDMKCYQCHKIEAETFPVPKEQEGGVGPDLTDIGSIQTPWYLFQSIMDPNAVIVQGEGYTGVDEKSLMPEYHDTMTLRQIVDMVAYLSSLKGK